MAEPKLKPLGQWVCDSCKELIETPDDGWLEWVGMDELPPQEFHIVHNNEMCFRHSRRRERQDNHLKYFLGPDGLVELMALFDPGLHNKPKPSDVVLPKDMLEWAEIVRRLHIPYYEEARQLWRIAASEGELDGISASRPYTQDFMLQIIEKYGDSVEGFV